MSLKLTIASTDAHSIYSIDPSGIRSSTACTTDEDTLLHAFLNGLIAINWRKHLQRIFGSHNKGKRLRLTVRTTSVELIESGAYLSKLEKMSTGMPHDVERLYRLLQHFDTSWMRVTDEDLAGLRSWAPGATTGGAR